MIKADVTMIVTATGYNRYLLLLWRWVLVVTFVETDVEIFLKMIIPGRSAATMRYISKGEEQ